MKPDEGNFLSRWSRRKVEAQREPVVVPAAAPPGILTEQLISSAPDSPQQPDPAANVPAASAPGPVGELPPTLADVDLLDRDSDFSRFVTPGTDEGVKHAAMKKLFSDPHFNVMDGLDTYIDDYGKPDPIPLVMLRQMAQSKTLRLFEHEEEEELEQLEPPPLTRLAEATTTSGPNLTLHNDNADLQLQPDHAAGRLGPDQGAGP